MRFLRKTDPYEFPIAMAGVRLADRLLVIGCRDPKLVAALATKSGLTGRACAIDASPERTASAARAIEREGALVETSAAPPWALPFDAGSFDVVVLHDALAEMTPEQRVGTLQGVSRVLRPGGRAVVIESSTRGGLGALLSRRAGNAQYESFGGATKALGAEGFVAVRMLADRDGLRFVEGVKRNA